VLHMWYCEIYLGIYGCNGKLLEDLSLLLRCPSTCSCVSSIERHPYRKIKSLPTESNLESLLMIRDIVQDMPGSRIDTISQRYLHAQFRSRWFGFVDDVHIVLNEGRIDVRSKSRFGYYDFGVNRRRVERISRCLLSRLKSVSRDIDRRL